MGGGLGAFSPVNRTGTSIHEASALRLGHESGVGAGER